MCRALRLMTVQLPLHHLVQDVNTLCLGLMFIFLIRALMNMGKLKFGNLKEGGRSGPAAFTAILFQTRASFIAKKCDLSFPETKELGSVRVCFCEKGKLCGKKQNGEWKNNRDLKTPNYAPALGKSET